MKKNEFKFAIGFVTYFPEPTFYHRLQWLSDLGIDVYVYDNSPNAISGQKAYENLPNTKYFQSGQNAGLGLGISKICKEAFLDGHKNFLFFDQDTGFSSETVEFIEQFIENNHQRLCLNYAAIVFKAETSKAILPAIVEDVLVAISSGSLFFLENLKLIGWHNQTYFVDGVDYECCLRARQYGLKIGKCGSTPGFDHVTEQPDKVFKVLNKKILLRRYSPVRIRDTLTSYRRLIISAIGYGDFYFAIAMLRSFAIYSAGQILSRMVLKKVN